MWAGVDRNGYHGSELWVYDGRGNLFRRVCPVTLTHHFWVDLIWHTAVDACDIIYVQGIVGFLTITVTNRKQLGYCIPSTTLFALLLCKMAATGG